MITAQDQIYTELVAIVGASRVSAGESVRAQFATGGKIPEVVVYPSSAEEVAEVLRYASTRGLAVIPVRNATKLVTGNPPRRYDIALSMKDLNRVWHYEPADLTISVEPGMKFGDFQSFVARHRLWLPLDPAGGARASVGGILAANASGSLRTHYGTARDMTLGLKIATPEGKVIKTGGRVVKNVAGYDFTKLMIGSFGTLGVIVEASFKLFPVPIERATLVLSAADLGKACEIHKVVQASSFRPLRFVLIDHGLSEQISRATHAPGAEYEFWIELGGTKRVLARCEDELKQIASRFGETLRSVVAALDGEEIWGRLQSIPEEAAASANDWLLKATLSISKIGEFLNVATRRFRPLGIIAGTYSDPLAGIVRLQLRSDAADGKLEDSVLKLRDLAGVLRGSLVVEVAPAAMEGRVDAWGPVGDDFETMRKLKEAWDPKGILSPGRFVGGI
ncbi:MAG TPA: FAD-binding oxidoreductase [Terriglobia bacterium]|nr:FAD-binding oxidoreductase [Terriglobia bacterium]